MKNIFSFGFRILWSTWAKLILSDSSSQACSLSTRGAFIPFFYLWVIFFPCSTAEESVIKGSCVLVGVQSLSSPCFVFSFIILLIFKMLVLDFRTHTEQTAKSLAAGCYWSQVMFTFFLVHPCVSK